MEQTRRTRLRTSYLNEHASLPLRCVGVLSIKRNGLTHSLKKSSLVLSMSPSFGGRCDLFPYFFIVVQHRKWVFETLAACAVLLVYSVSHVHETPFWPIFQLVPARNTFFCILDTRALLTNNAKDGLAQSLEKAVTNYVLLV